MKYIIILCYFLFGCCLIEAQNPTRTILFTCDPNEELYYEEYYSNMKTVGNKFACKIYNKQTKKYSFVLNGLSIVKADYIEVYLIDLDSKNDCIYLYSNGEDKNYIFIEGKTYGPYEAICYGGCDGYARCYPSDPNFLYNKNQFRFKRMGKIFRHDNDGTIYECTGDKVWPNLTEIENNPTFHSLSGQHKAEFSDNYRVLTVDGIPYIMPIDNDSKWLDLKTFAIIDNGDCLIEFRYNHNNNWYYPYFLISNNTIHHIKDNEYYNQYFGKFLKFQFHI